MRTTAISVSLAVALLWAFAAEAQTTLYFEQGPCMHNLYYGSNSLVQKGYSDFHLQLDDTTVLVARVILSPDARTEVPAPASKTIGCDNRSITLAEIHEVNSGNITGLFLESAGPGRFKQYPINQLSLIIETERYFKYVCPEYSLYFDLNAQVSPETVISSSDSRLQAMYKGSFSLEVGGREVPYHSWTTWDLEGKFPPTLVEFVPGIGHYGVYSQNDSTELLMVNGQNLPTFLQDFAVGKQKLRGKMPVLPSQETAKPAENPVAAHVPNESSPAAKPMQPVSPEPSQTTETQIKTPPVLLGGQLDQGGYYTVQVNDYLYAIAKQFNVPVNTIMSQNQLATNQLKVGQRLLIRTAAGYTPPAPANTVSPAAPTVGANGVHIVQKNEDIYSVAEKYGISIVALIELNRLNSFDLVPGQQIIYKAGAVKASPIAQKARLGYHIVQKDETLGSIAERYSTTVGELIEWNRIVDVNSIQIGQELRIQRPDPSAPVLENPPATEPFPPLPGGSASTAATSMHIVEKGQNLYRIALQYGTTVNELKRINGLQEDAVKIGQQLIVPGRGQAVQPPKEAVKKLPVPIEENRPPKTAPPAGPVYHVVQKGEFLNGIAQKHGTTAAALVKLNGLADANHIRPGQKLRVK